MKTKLDPQEKARRQAWRTAHVEARDQVAAAKQLRGETPLPQPRRKPRTSLAIMSAAAFVAGIESPRL
jgi:hypothetical protein